MNKGYHWFYRNYWWLLLTLFAATVCVPMVFDAGGDGSSLMIVLAANIALFFFVQKQRLMILKISTDLLIHFDGRFAELRPQLRRIVDGDPSAELTTELNMDQVDDLHAYFDLCAEEYFQFTRGVIPPEAWASWLGGMRVYYYNPRVRRLWDKALTQHFFYGFDNRLLK
jgi:hypothetical protein